MKKLAIVIMILMATMSYSKELFKVIDTEYVLDNYYKSKNYNEKLKNSYSHLSKKNKMDIFNLDYKEIKDSELKKEIIKLKKDQKEYVDEVNEDLMIAIYINYPNDTIFPIETILTGRTLNISDKVLKFLNDVYSPKIILKKGKYKLNDDIL